MRHGDVAHAPEYERGRTHLPEHGLGVAGTEITHVDARVLDKPIPSVEIENAFDDVGRWRLARSELPGERLLPILARLVFPLQPTAEGRPPLTVRIGYRRARHTRRIDQDQPRHRLRLGCRLTEPDDGARRGGDDRVRTYAQLRQQPIHELGAALHRIATLRVGAGQPRQRKIETNDTVIPREIGGEPVPTVQTHERGMQHHDHRTRTLVLVVHTHAVDVDEPGGRRRVAGLQGRQRNGRRTQRPRGARWCAE